MLIYTLTTGEGPHLATTCRWGEEYGTRYGRSYVMDNLWRRCMTRSLSATRQMRKVHLARRICRSVDSCGWKLLRGAAGRNHVIIIHFAVQEYWTRVLTPADMALMRPGESQKDVIGGYASQSVMVFLNFTSIVEQTKGLFLIIILGSHSPKSLYWRWIVHLGRCLSL